ncbi:MAG: hypothetical protein ABI772_09065 [Bacteroidota bacterium]
MRNLMVVLFSCFTILAGAQDNKEEMKTPVKQKPVTVSDKNGLDGRSFRITIKSKGETSSADMKTSETAKPVSPVNQTGINTGTIKEQPAADPKDIPAGTVIPDEHTGGVSDVPVKSPADEVDNHIGVNTTLSGQPIAATESSLATDLDKTTMTLIFSDGTLKAANVESKSRESSEQSAEQTVFANCSYDITSGGGIIATFSSNCNQGNNGERAYWNGFINEGVITGNLVVYSQKGGSQQYTFSGKATKKDANRKATSLK